MGVDAGGRRRRWWGSALGVGAGAGGRRRRWGPALGVGVGSRRWGRCWASAGVRARWRGRRVALFGTWGDDRPGSGGVGGGRSWCRGGGRRRCRGGGRRRWVRRRLWGGGRRRWVRQGGWCCAPRTRCDVRLVKVPPTCDLRLKPERVSPQRRQLPMVLRSEELEELVEVCSHLRAGGGQDGLKQNALNANGHR